MTFMILGIPLLGPGTNFHRCRPCETHVFKKSCVSCRRERSQASRNLKESLPKGSATQLEPHGRVERVHPPPARPPVTDHTARSLLVAKATVGARPDLRRLQAQRPSPHGRMQYSYSTGHDHPCAWSKSFTHSFLQSFILSFVNSFIQSRRIEKSREELRRFEKS